ncbi:MAG: hypothetical protein EBS65_24045, partial [Betaproteobacteria bacterium]|nr:hypothetical protein [Betaproteobacteria bacterium]
RQAEFFDTLQHSPAQGVAQILAGGGQGHARRSLLFCCFIEQQDYLEIGFQSSLFRIKHQFYEKYEELE